MTAVVSIEYSHGALIEGNIFNRTWVFLSGEGSILIDNTFRDTTVYAGEGIGTSFCRDGVGDDWPESYLKITNSLTLDPECTYNIPYGIEIRANNIDFDCRGALINGSGEAFPQDIWPTGVSAYWRDNITVQNCDVRNFYAETDHGPIGDGIVLEQVVNSTIRNNHVTNVAVGVRFNGTERAENNLAESNVIDTSREGLHLGGNYSTARNNTIRNARDWSITVGSSHLLIEGNTVFGNPDNPWGPGALVIAPGRETEDIAVPGNGFHGGVVVVSDWGGFAPENVTFLQNLLNNSFLSLESPGTRLCDNGTFNSFVGRSGIWTRVGMDLDPSCAWNLPLGIAAEGVEGIGIDCHGALVNGSNLAEGTGIRVQNSRAVRVENCTLRNYGAPQDTCCSAAAVAFDTEDVTFSGLDIADSQFGFFGGWNRRLVEEDSAISGVETGIGHWENEETNISRNTVSGVTGFSLGGQAFSLFGNSVTAEDNNLALFDSRIEENIWTGSSFAVWGDYSTYVGNTFDGIFVEDNGIDNIWCEYPKGNYYIDSAYYSGPNPYGGTCPPADSDDDGVPDDVDKCLDTILPELLELNPNHYADIDGDGIFETTEPKGKDKAIVDSDYTLVDTYGCSCEQILALKPGRDKGEYKHGCTKGILQDFIEGRGWAKSGN